MTRGNIWVIVATTIVEDYEGRNLQPTTELRPEYGWFSKPSLATKRLVGLNERANHYYNEWIKEQDELFNKLKGFRVQRLREIEILKKHHFDYSKEEEKGLRESMIKEPLLKIEEWFVRNAWEGVWLYTIQEVSFSA